MSFLWSCQCLTTVEAARRKVTTQGRAQSNDRGEAPRYVVPYWHVRSGKADFEIGRHF